MEEYLADLNWYDTSVLTVLALSTILAFFRGFLKAVFSLVTWLGSAAATLVLFPVSNNFFINYMDPTKAKIAAVAGIFILVFITIALINNQIVYWLRHYRGGAMDRTMGLAFGVARGVLIVGLVFFSLEKVWVVINLEQKDGKIGPDWFVNAKTYSFQKVVTATVMSFIPDEMVERLENTIEVAQEITKESISEVTEANAGKSDEKLPVVLNSSNKILMGKVMSSLPEEQLRGIYSKYEGNISKISEEDKVEIFRKIYEAYKDAKSQGQLQNGGVLSDNDIVTLEKGLYGEVKKDEDVGYNNSNIKELDRLIQTIE